MVSLNELLRPYACLAEQWLDRWLIEPGTPETLAEAMRYCALSGGKRLRPALAAMAAEAVGGKPIADIAPESAETVGRAAVAVELVHCYSLVHDDLPCMDDDELRRGQPTAHVKYGEAMALLTGDALLTRAFAVLGESSSPVAAALTGELARGAGPAGMVAGQVADLQLCEVPAGADGLNYIHRRKTAALIRAAARMGAMCVAADGEALQAVNDYSESIGLAFQLVDDLLDVTGRAEIIGKTPGKDQASGKRTYVSELGLEATRDLVDQTTARAIQALSPLGAGCEKLLTLSELLAERGH